MERCANTESREAYEEQIACAENAIQECNDDLEPYLEQIEEILVEMRVVVKHYEGHELDYLIKERINDLL